MQHLTHRSRKRLHILSSGFLMEFLTLKEIGLLYCLPCFFPRSLQICSLYPFWHFFYAAKLEGIVNNLPSCSIWETNNSFFWTVHIIIHNPPANWQSNKKPTHIHGLAPARIFPFTSVFSVVLAVYINLSLEILFCQF